MFSVALALLVAQIVSVFLIYRASEDRRETAILTAAAFQLATGPERSVQREALRMERGAPPARPEPRPPGGLPRPLRYVVAPDAPFDVPPSGQEGASERRLRLALSEEGIAPQRAGVSVIRAGDDPVLQRFAENRPRFRDRTEWQERRLFVATIQRESGAQWETVRVLEPVRQRGAFGVLLFQTLVTFAILIVILFFVLRRITRPLARLTERVGDFSRAPDKVVLIEESGPADTRRLIAAHNAMETRIAALLDEKDVMLGAIGHDLKTPLAALRVRIESVADDTQRAKMAQGIEDITATLDDILSLSRVGRNEAGKEAVDLGALAIGIAEEFEDLGEPVTIADPPRLVAKVQVTWIKRALRNLVSNAVRYGQSAEISVLSENGEVVLRVEDRGPGIPEHRIADMIEPFKRGEASRNRATGGAGLGLTLARAIAEQHGGKLVLSNRNEGGLRAELRLPKSDS